MNECSRPPFLKNEDKNTTSGYRSNFFRKIEGTSRIHTFASMFLLNCEFARKTNFSDYTEEEAEARPQ